MTPSTSSKPIAWYKAKKDKLVQAVLFASKHALSSINLPESLALP
jgi:hypothetical protein